MFCYSLSLKEGREAVGSRSEVTRGFVLGAELRLDREPGQDQVGER